MIHTIRVVSKDTKSDTRANSLRSEIETVLGIQVIQEILIAKFYWLEGCSAEEAKKLAEGVLCDAVTQAYTLEQPEHNGCHRVCVAYIPGVMNPEAQSILKVVKEFGVKSVTAADSGFEYVFPESLSDEQVQHITSKLLMNKVVQRVVTQTPETLLVSDVPGGIEIVPIRTLTDVELRVCSRKRNLFLNLEEMQVIRKHFRSLERDPKDGELETIAQTWSEHCGHKTFKARIIVDGMEKRPLFERLKETALKHDDLILSAFDDNSGVIRFYDDFGICAKWETHNSPSALEPYGGAMTGVGGDLRDILGTGQGAHILAGTDVFCLAPPDLPMELVPKGCLPPRYLFQHVVRGVRDYGNRMGVPTLNGSVHFHLNFRAKPTVLVGAYGIIPKHRCKKGAPQAGDLVIAVGGRTGRDGIHGATFSSGEMTAHTAAINGTAVQIGNAVEERRMADAIIACRDADLIVAITDCGAGGFASAVGEMGSRTGVRVALEKAPLKYTGLSPWEIWLSESQERMVVAVHPENEDEFIAMCKDTNVEATVIGVFTDDRRLIVNYHEKTLCDLSMEFLHNGLPQRVMTATKPKDRDDSDEQVLALSDAAAFSDAYVRVMAHGDVCSKEPIVRTYDHTVQGRSALPPFSGVLHDGPNDAAVICPILGKPYGMVMSHGGNPVLNTLDPYWGSIWAGVEALANYVAVGGNVHEAALIDNFIWPFPDEESLWDLDRAVDACVTLMDTFGIPFVSGKDSLSSTYKNDDGTVLKIPPVLNISVFGRIPDVEKTVTADFKRTGSVIVMLGLPDYKGMGGSVFTRSQGYAGGRVPKAALEKLPGLFDLVHRNIVSGRILSCHDISEGGLAASLAEMCFGGNCGANIERVFSHVTSEQFLFNESPGCFLVEMDPAAYDSFLKDEWDAIGRVRYLRIGHTIAESEIHTPLFSISVAALKDAWQQPMKEVFHS